MVRFPHWLYRSSTSFDLVLYRRRSAILTHETVIAKERAYKTTRDNKVVTRNNKKAVAIIKNNSGFRLRLTVGSK
jgi:hypothetical protein